ncbi:hypothetical protein SARC_04626 [Sphaeroforma arctica JP610]|uniref:Uncharacterized protein n=1 Tax=Sphaeroforma arctica JP610 TaxID=667725 RepID=A0A0L0G1V5_9EUKA|nr:hypothetical protein SARC_04626 [Sphaeroforma arctica JP610]KNC83107.1 hypothetical protein SARC_04626 [Sphaeroforma arctica JP610]|eukprot:XP_014157009.1 hypothetical protein SARC_04626 [Sphaeroforma arctica JP610]
MEIHQYENPLQVYRNHGVLTLIWQAAGTAYYSDSLHVHPHWRDYSAEETREVFRVSIDKAEEHRRQNIPRSLRIPGGSRSRSQRPRVSLCGLESIDIGGIVVDGNLMITFKHQEAVPIILAQATTAKSQLT